MHVCICSATTLCLLELCFPFARARMSVRFLLFFYAGLPFARPGHMHVGPFTVKLLSAHDQCLNVSACMLETGANTLNAHDKCVNVPAYMLETGAYYIYNMYLYCSCTLYARALPARRSCSHARASFGCGPRIHA